MRVPVAIESEHDSFCVGLRFGVPTVDLRQDRFHFRIAQFVFRIPPVQRAQRFVEADRLIASPLRSNVKRADA